MHLVKPSDRSTTDRQSICREMIGVYENLKVNNLETLRQIYSEDVSFEDPAHGIQGIDTLITYLRSLYQNLESCQFKFHKEVTSGEDIFLTWTMFIRHKKIHRGQTIRVEGASYLKTRGDKIFYHRDYFDLGAMVYENVPLLGGVVRQIKNRLGQ